MNGKTALTTAIISTVIVLLLFGYCSEYKKRQDIEKLAADNAKELVHVNALRDSTIKMVKDSFAHKIYTAELRLVQESAVRSLAEKDAKRYRDMLAAFKVDIRYKRDTIKVSYTDTLRDTLYYGRPFAYTDRWLSFNGTVDSNKVGIYNLNMNAGNLSILVGYRNRGLFRKPEPVVEVKTDCQYLFIPSVETAFKKPPVRPWWDSRAAWFIYGAASKTLLNIGINNAAGKPIVW